MKGVILQRQKEYAAVLMEDGTVQKLRVSGDVGTEIDTTVITFAKKPSNNTKAFLSMAIAAAVILISSFGFTQYQNVYAKAVSYVTLDTSTGEDSSTGISIEYALNSKNQVISYTALSPEGEVIVEQLEAMNLGRCSLSEALDATSSLLPEYQNDAEENEDSSILLNVATDREDASNQLTKELSQSPFQKQGYTTEVTNSSLEDRKNAMNASMSTGRYDAYQKALEEEEGELPEKPSASSPEEPASSSQGATTPSTPSNEPSSIPSEDTENAPSSEYSDNVPTEDAKPTSQNSGYAPDKKEEGNDSTPLQEEDNAPENKEEDHSPAPLQEQESTTQAFQPEENPKENPNSFNPSEDGTFSNDFTGPQTSMDETNP
ncbi:MAG: hypothetical protein K6C69_02180 [Lachnospiraceae bacterium]|nr:hypothetical protein [Lachnospiraceae bacterium]